MTRFGSLLREGRGIVSHSVSRTSDRCIVLILAARIGALMAGLTCLAPAMTSAQPFQEVPLLAKRVVAFRVGTDDFNDQIPNQDRRLWSVASHSSYAPLLDQRRRILANPWVRSIELSGPVRDLLRLSRDECRENDTNRSDLKQCTPPASNEVDRLELDWIGAGTPDQVFFDQLNDPGVGPQQTLEVFPFQTRSLTDPGVELRLVSGPPVPHVQQWSAMTAPPLGEGTGYLIDQITLFPFRTGERGSDQPPQIAPYEHVSGVLLGSDPAGPFGEDSVYFTLPPSTLPQTVAIWFRPVPSVSTASVAAYVSCGQKPDHTAMKFPSRVAGQDQPIFVDLSGQKCLSGWHVVLASSEVQDVVFHMTVAEHLSQREFAELRIGIEFVTSGPPEEALIRATLRQAAWRFYGVTGGTQLLRSFRYNPSGACSNVHVCWRNRPKLAGCAFDGQAVTDTMTGSVHICSLPMFGNVGPNAATLSHEFGHAFAKLADEYWASNDFAKICGFSGVGIRRCSHSVMGYQFDNRNSLCTSQSHDRAPELFIQQPGENPKTGAWPWTTGPFNVLGPNTITECANGETNFAGPFAVSAWNQMQAAGIVPLPHPNRTPVNFNYQVFSRSPARQEIGQNLN